jgi:hypothetical protein
MLEARIHLLRLVTARINHPYEFARSGSTPSVIIPIRNPHRILGCEQIAELLTGRGWRRSARDNELMGWQAWSLVSLEHTIAESVLFRELEVGVNSAG